MELTQHNLGTQERAWEPQEGGWGPGDWGWEPWDWVGGSKEGAWGSGEVAWGRGWGSREGLFPGEAGALPGLGCVYISGGVWGFSTTPASYSPSIPAHQATTQ